MSSWGWRTAYELKVLRQARWVPWLVAALLAVTVGMTVVVGLSMEAYYELDERLRWAAVVTQGGVLGWPPLFAFFLALLGVLLWAQDAGGESSYVAYSSFPDRWRTALVRSALLTAASAALAVSVAALAAVIGWLCFDLGPPSGHLSLIGTKALWTVVCGVAFAHLGAVLCVVSRSPLIATALLLVIPWVLEPVVVELGNLVAGLAWLAPALRFLPFRVAGDVVGSPELESTAWSVGGQLAPLPAAVTAVVLAVASAALVHWRHCRADAR